MATTLQKQIIGQSVISQPVENVWHNLRSLVEQGSEWFWFLLSFALFLVLGPFSAPIALMAIFKLGLEDNNHTEPESISS